MKSTAPQMPPETRAILNDFARKPRRGEYADAAGRVLLGTSHYQDQALAAVRRRGLLAWFKRCSCLSACRCEGKGFHLTDAGALALQTGVLPEFTVAQMDETLANIAEQHAESAAIEAGNSDGFGCWCNGCATLAEMVLQLRAAQAWHPMDTAPTDGTPILGWVPGYGQRMLVWVVPFTVPSADPPGYKEAPGVWRLVGGMEVYNPTKWLILPPDPVED